MLLRLWRAGEVEAWADVERPLPLSRSKHAGFADMSTPSVAHVLHLAPRGSVGTAGGVSRPRAGNQGLRCLLSRALRSDLGRGTAMSDARKFTTARPARSTPSEVNLSLGLGMKAAPQSEILRCTEVANRDRDLVVGSSAH